MWIDDISDVKEVEIVLGSEKSLITNTFYNTALEKSFPLTFSFVIHKYPQQDLQTYKVTLSPTECVLYILRYKIEGFIQRGVLQCCQVLGQCDDCIKAGECAVG